jgi:hypothetical protein
MPPESGDPRVCRAWPGVGTTFSNPLNTVQPGGSPDVPSAGASGSGDEAGVPTQAMDSRDHSGSESMRVTPADTEPSTKPGSKPPQRARRSSAPSLVYPSDRNGAVRMVETPLSHTQSTFSHFQSTFSHMWVHIQSTWGSTYVATWTPWRSTSKGVARGRVEKAGGPYTSGAGRPDGLGE